MSVATSGAKAEAVADRAYRNASASITFLRPSTSAVGPTLSAARIAASVGGAYNQPNLPVVETKLRRHEADDTGDDGGVEAEQKAAQRDDRSIGQRLAIGCLQLGVSPYWEPGASRQERRRCYRPRQDSIAAVKRAAISSLTSIRVSPQKPDS